MFPSGRADFATTGRPDLAESTDLTEHLRDIPSHWRSKDLGRLDDAVGIDNEPSSDIDIGIFVEHVVLTSDLSTGIGQHRERYTIRHQFAEFVFFPALVDEMRVYRTDINLNIEFGQCLLLSSDRCKFGWSDKGEVAGVE